MVAVSDAIGSGGLSALQRWFASAPAGGSGNGSMGARVAVKSGNAVLQGNLSGEGCAAASTNAGYTNISATSVGSISTSLHVRATTEALFGGEGGYAGLVPESAHGAAHGMLTASVGAAGAVAVAVALTGNGDTAARSGSVADSVGVGTLAALTGSPADGMGSGMLSHTNTPLSNAPADLVGNGVLSVVAKTSFQPSAMKKDGVAWSGMDKSWKTITGWTVDPAYPGSTVSGNGLVVQSGKAGATLEASVPFTAGMFSGADVTLRLTVNGTPEGVTGSLQNVASNSVTTVTVSGQFTVVTGDVITLQVKSESAVAAYNPTIAAGAVAHVRVT
ncbi:hypothetical protein [Nocardia sp. IFM 10818]